MNSPSRAFTLALIVGILAVNAAPLARADLLTTGDILIMDENFGSPSPLREYTPSGTLLQTFSVSQAPSGDTQSRAITVDSNGYIDVYNGTFSPYLTTINPVTKTVVNNATVSGWSTVNNITYGGLAAIGHYVYATDMTTGIPGSNGLIQFDVNNGYAGQRFGNTTYANGYGDNIQVAAGKNGLLYAEYPGTSPGGSQVSVYNPITLSLINNINLNMDLRDIAVDPKGNIFAVNIYDPHIYEFDPNGNLINTLTTTTNGFSGIAINSSGQIVANSGGVLVITNDALSGYTTLNVGTTSPVGTFVAWVEPPVAGVAEPGSLLLVAIGIGLLVMATWRRTALIMRQPIGASVA